MVVREQGAEVGELSTLSDDIVERVDNAVLEAAPAEHETRSNYSRTVIAVERETGVRGGLMAMTRQDPYFWTRLGFALWMSTAMEVSEEVSQ